jgi:hypothetical protein
MFSFENAVRPAPLHAVSALALAVTDWVAFGLNIATAMHAYWPVTLGTALVGGALTTLVQQRYAKDGLRRALIKGAVVVALVAVPLPVTGTALALAALTWAWMSAVSRPD